jgi:uncharacterized phosphatase
MGGDTIILIRHAEADYGALGVHEPIFRGARRDFAPLSEAGIQQARRTAERLRTAQIRLMVSSPYTRALQTASILASELPCPMVVDVRLHDWLPVRDAWQPISAAVVAEKIDEYELWTRSGNLPQDRSWETAEEMSGRLKSVIADHRLDLPLAVVTHEAPIQSLIGPVAVREASIHTVSLSEMFEPDICQ